MGAVLRTRPFIEPTLCKGCGRCVDSCVKECITCGTEILPASGLTPVLVDLTACNGCGLCIDACPEPFGLQPVAREAPAIESAHGWVPSLPARPVPVAVLDEHVAVAPARPLVVKGTYASAIGALYAGCRHFFGYPITPSTEGAELMARFLPRLGGEFVQAVSEVARST